MYFNFGPQQSYFDIADTLPGTITGYAGGSWDIGQGGEMIPRTPGPGVYPGRDERMAALTADLPAGAPKEKGKGGAWKGILASILGSVGDSLAGNDNFAKTQLLKRKADQDAIDAWRQQQYEFQRQVALAQWKRDNPDPSEFDRAISGGGIDPKSTQGQTIYRQRAESMANPPIIQNVPGVGIVTMPRPTSTPAGPPPGAIEYLRQHPDTANFFDQKYGTGSAASILGRGGASPSSGSPTFRPF